MRGKMRVAVAGAGYFSRFHYDAWSRLAEAELVAACDLDRSKAETVAGLHAVPEVFDDVARMLDAVRPDVLDIVTPPASHFDSIRLAAERGIAVICQKAFCRSLAEAQAAVEVARAAGIALIVHENFRFQPWHREIKRLVGAGLAGDVYQATFRLRPGDGQGPQAYLDRQPYFQSMPQFLVHETAIHLIDVFRFLFGEPVSVYADLRRHNPVIKGEDAGHILLEFQGGRRALIDANRLADHAARNPRLTMGEMDVEGSSGTISLDGDGGLRWRAHGAREPSVLTYAWQDRGFAGDCVHATQQAALDAILGRSEAVNSGADYLANLRLEAAIYESSRLGHKIAVP